MLGGSTPTGQQSLHQAMLDNSPPLKHNGPPASGSNGEEPMMEGSSQATGNGGASPSSTLGDDEDDDDDADDDADKPAASSPAMLSSTTTTPTKENLAGRTKRNRNELGDDEATQNEDELDYPRKRTSRRLSTTDHGMLAYDLSGLTDDDAMDNAFALALEDEDELVDDDDEDDEDHDIENEEEEAIIRELEMDAESLGADPEDEGDETIRAFDNFSELSADFDLGAIRVPGDPLEDLDSELFNVQWNDPHRFDDIDNSYLDFPVFASDTDNDLFTADPTPTQTPHDTPRGSISLTQEERNNFPDVFSTEDEESGQEIDLTPFFEKGAAIKHFVSTEGKGRWGDETEDEAELVKYFFSSDEGGDNEAEDDSDIDDDMCRTNLNLCVWCALLILRFQQMMMRQVTPPTKRRIFLCLLPGRNRIFAAPPCHRLLLFALRSFHSTTMVMLRVALALLPGLRILQNPSALSRVPSRHTSFLASAHSSA